MEVVLAEIAIVLLFMQIVKTECAVNAETKSAKPEMYTLPVGVNLFMDSPLSMQVLIQKKRYTTAYFEYVEFSQDVRENCSHYSILTEFNYVIPVAAYSRYTKIQENTALVSRTITRLLSRSNAYYNATYGDRLYFAQAKSLLASDKNIFGVTIAFDSNIYNGKSSAYFCPHVYRTSSGRIEEMDLKDLCSLNSSVANNWFLRHGRNFTKELPKNRWKDFLGGSQQKVAGFWTAPYFDCMPNGSNTMMTSYSLPFYGHHTSEDSLAFKGAVGVHISLDDYDVNQCADDGSSFFAGTHRCKTETTQCVHIPGRGFRRGSYYCQCKPGYVFPGHQFPSNQSYFNGTDIEEDFVLYQLGQPNKYGDFYQCSPCKKRCDDCESDGLCYVERHILLRGIPLGVQSFSITIVVVLGIVIVYKRSHKVFKLSMWPLLELVILGSIFIYVTVIVMYFEPSTEVCLLVPWMRETGFAVMYGVLLLKVYRVLAEFQTRKARRVHVRDKDLLKYLLVIVIVVVGYMASWTAVSMEHHTVGLTEKIQAHDGLWFHTCKSSWWNYFVEISEFLFTLFGLYLCYCVRDAPVDFSETKYISIALLNELIMSATFHIARHFVYSWLHPDHAFLIYFLRCQVTVTVTLVLILAPKMWYASQPVDFRSRAYSTTEVLDSILPESMKLQLGISSNGDVDVGEVNISEMDPEDIRLELKRIYTQLQVYKTKNMRKDNPHISKRKGGKKQGRRFSLQPFAHQKHRSICRELEHDISESIAEVTKTPEESTVSGDVFTYDLDNKRADGPTVTFKRGTKH